MYSLGIDRETRLLGLWAGTITHQVTLNSASHQDWMTSEIGYYDILNGWYVWDSHQIYNGDTFSNETVQDVTEFILGKLFQ